MSALLQLKRVGLWLWADRRAQDMVEYSLAAAFVAVTASAFFPPAIALAISTVMSRVIAVLPTP